MFKQNKGMKLLKPCIFVFSLCLTGYVKGGARHEPSIMNRNTCNNFNVP